MTMFKQVKLTKIRMSFLKKTAQISPPILLFLTSLLVLLILSSFLILKIVYLGRIYPGVFLGKVDLSGQNLPQASKHLSKALDNYQALSFTFKADGYEEKIAIADWGISFDKEATFKKVSLSGRTGDLPFDFLTIYQSLFQKTRVEPQIVVDQEKYLKKVEQLAQKFDRIGLDPQIVLEKGEIKITEAQEGAVLDRINLEEQLILRAKNLVDTPITLAILKEKPNISTQEAQKLKREVEELLQKDLTLTFEQTTFSLSREKIAPMISFGEEDQITALKIQTPSFSLSFGPIKKAIVQVEEEKQAKVFLSEGKLAEFVSGMAKEINRPAQNSQFLLEGGKVKIISGAVDGLELNREEATEKIKKSITQESDKEKIAINLPVKVTTGRVVSGELERLGIKEQIGRGWSNFAGSQEGRSFNIALAASRVNGALVAPGEVFSFNSAVGDISAETGYKTAYIIERGRTIFGTGGGVCQVSTTAFRAALDSGLPIVERRPHAYRVRYYEQAGHQPGFDATIFQPSVDFRFKNDTPGHILIHSYVSGANLYFDFYGTNDGRVVEISKAQVAGVTPPPEPLYEDDPSLPKGVTKQADFAAWGASVSISRTVKRTSEVLSQETFKSHYKAWQAVYKVGTG